VIRVRANHADIRESIRDNIIAIVKMRLHDVCVCMYDREERIISIDNI